MIAAGQGKSLFSLICAFSFFAILPSRAIPSPKTQLECIEATGLKETASSLHFTVFSDDAAFSRDVLARLESTLQRIISGLGLKQRLLEKCLVFVWPSRGDFVEGVASLGAPHPEYSGGFAIAATARDPHQLYLFRDKDLFTNVIPHELSHLMLEIILNLSRRREIPPWLHEGFAQSQEERSVPDLLRTILDARAAGNFIPLGDVSRYREYPHSAEKLRLFYLESEALVRFLMEEQAYPGEFLNFCERMVFWGDNLEQAIRMAYRNRFPNLKTLEELWLNYLANTAARPR